jgi:hypothetical protein
VRRWAVLSRKTGEPLGTRASFPGAQASLGLQPGGGVGVSGGEGRLVETDSRLIVCR